MSSERSELKMVPSIAPNPDFGKAMGLIFRFKGKAYSQEFTLRNRNTLNLVK